MRESVSEISEQVGLKLFSSVEETNNHKRRGCGSVVERSLCM